MPRTAPTIDGTPTYRQVSFRYIDASGDKRSEAIRIDAAVTDALIEAWADKAQQISNASLYEVAITSHYSSVADKSDAVGDAPSDSVFDNIVVLAKNAVGDRINGYILAPSKADLMVEGTDQIDPTSVGLASFLTAFLAVIPAGYSVVSARFSERSEINTAVSI